MRDDRHLWPAAISGARPDLSGPGVTIRLVQAARQTVLSGPYEAAMALAGLTGDAVGSGAIAQGSPYAIRQRRDRILVIGGGEIADGWHEAAGVAVADMTAAYGVIEVTGVRAERLLATGTEFAANQPSASAARLWHGFSCLIYRYQSEDSFRIHVRSAHLEAAWEMLGRQVDLVARLPELPRRAGDDRLADAEADGKIPRRQAG